MNHRKEQITNKIYNVRLFSLSYCNMFGLKIKTDSIIWPLCISMLCSLISLQYIWKPFFDKNLFLKKIDEELSRDVN